VRTVESHLYHAYNRLGVTNRVELKARLAGDHAEPTGELHRPQGRNQPRATRRTVIDTHVHHLDLNRFRYPWLDDPEFDALRTDYLPADYRADAGDVEIEGWVHVQADVDHDSDPVEETSWLSRLAEQARASGQPGPLACVV
jgi:hypothetical protein